MEDEQLLEIALLAGKALSLANAEASRIEDTMKRILQIAMYEHIEVLAQSSNILVSYQDAEAKITRMVRIQGHALALDKIHSVNAISRSVCMKEMKYEEALASLNTLLKQNELPISYPVLFGLWLLGPAFVLVFKGELLELIAVMFLALLYVLLYKFTWKLNTLLFYLLASTMLAYGSVYLKELLSMHQFVMQLDIVIVSSIMPMVPGIAITNALRDIMNQDYVSGTTKLLESFAQAGSIAFGIGFGYALGAFL